jgi:hypothetical protein
MQMTLEEAILHAEEVAEEQKEKAKEGRLQFETWDYISKCEECASEHRQLAEWLKELKDYKDRQDLINKSWQELINYKEGIEKIKMRSQVYRERGENILASGMEQALDILEEVNADE